MRTRTLGFGRLLVCGALVFAVGADGGADSLPAAAEVPPPETPSSPSVLRETLGELGAEIEKLPAGVRRGRFQWVRDRLSRMAEGKEETHEAGNDAAKLLAAIRNGQGASDAVPWFDEGHWQGVRMFDNERIGLAFVGGKEGVALESLYDLRAERELLSGAPTPFWTLVLTDPKGERKERNSAEGPGKFGAKESVGKTGSERTVEMKWFAAPEEGAEPLRVTCLLSLAGEKAAWRMSVDNPSTTWSIRTIVFPRISFGRIGVSEEDDFLVIPHGSGGLRQAPLKTKAEFSGRYPGGWCSMQFFTHYDADCGLYLGVHDPFASTKDLKATAARGSSLEASFAWPAPDSGLPGNDWECPGKAVLRVFRGDWFDAARIYREWVAKEATWWPERGRRGRGDTPDWFQEIAVWAQTGGGPEQVVPAVKEFAEYMGVPTALHWYNWHSIPFDNDYPHYFPYKKGVPEAVKALHDAGVRVMPYINGRLWDTDLEDFKKNAVRFCTKDEKGQPYIEVYGSGEKLCPMCPTTDLWQRTVQELVLRLVGPEVDVDAVYVDQVAAATPRLCFDRAHGHPLGGGHWWNTSGYWPMLTELQKEMADRFPEKALTTECNAEPYVHVFDGYLTWHFQYANQIPLFAAVYGGKIQLFSRAYQGDSWKGLAMRMKTGQALVFGEQLGWINPRVLSDAESAAFLRRMARLRYALRDYLARGEMARPPTLKGTIPTVTADWQWSGKRLVTTPAILSGAWRAQNGRLAFIFVNVSDAAQEAVLEFDAETYGLDKAPFVRVIPCTESGAGKPAREARRFRRTITLRAHDAVAFEVLPGS